MARIEEKQQQIKTKPVYGHGISAITFTIPMEVLMELRVTALGAMMEAQGLSDRVNLQTIIDFVAQLSLEANPLKVKKLLESGNLFKKPDDLIE